MLNPFLCVYQKFSHDIEKVKLIFMSIQSCQATSKESKAVLQNPAEGKKYVTQVVRFTVQGSAPPLTAEAASLIEKETPALRSHIRGFPAKSGIQGWGQGQN